MSSSRVESAGELIEGHSLELIDFHREKRFVFLRFPSFSIVFLHLKELYRPFRYFWMLFDGFFMWPLARFEVDLLRDGAGRATGEAVLIFAALRDAHTAVQRYHGGDLNGRRLEAVYEGEVNASR